MPGTSRPWVAPSPRARGGSGRRGGRNARSGLQRALLLCSALGGGGVLVGCGGAADGATTAAATPSDEDAAPAPAAVVTPSPTATASAATTAAPAVDAAPIAAVTGLTSPVDPAAGGTTDPAAAPAADSADSAAATTTAGADAPADSAAPTPPDAAAADPAAQATTLLSEVSSKRTKDARATEALAEAEKLGATPRDLATAALKRGKALFASPEQAATWFKWAADKDPKFPDPVFELARQSVVTGEIEPTRVLLQQVAERGGKKLLKQIEFDPTWEIVKDDPEVKKLLK